MRCLGLALALVGCSYSPPAATVDAPDVPVDTIDAPESTRVGGAAGYWKFDDALGDTIRDYAPPPADRSPMDLTIGAPGETAWVDGGLEITGRVAIASAPAPHIGQTIQNKKTVSIEVWISPANATQGDGTDPPDGAPDYAAVFMASGSILSYSALIAQAGERWIARSRTNTPTLPPDRAAGFPEIQSPPPVVLDEPTHLVLVTSPTERTLYVDGVAHTSMPDGVGMIDWDPSYQLRLGDHSVGYERAWTGTMWLLAIYDRALSPDEVMQNRDAGYDCADC